MTEPGTFCNIRAVELTLDLVPSRQAYAFRLPFPRLAAISLVRAGDMGASSAGASPDRNRYLSAFDVAPARCYTNRQVHSRDIVVFSGESVELVDERGSARAVDSDGRIEADGVVLMGGAKLRGAAAAPAGEVELPTTLAVTVADCLPLFLYDHGTESVALLHSGWKGTGILDHALAVMAERGGSPQQLELLIGPGIGPCCYHVTKERADDFARRFGAESVRAVGDKRYLDLPQANLAIARRWGVGRISRLKSCTQCNAAYHSFRRDGPEHFGHMLAFCNVA